MSKQKVEELKQQVQESLADALDLTKNRKLRDCISAASNSLDTL